MIYVYAIYRAWSVEGIKSWRYTSERAAEATRLMTFFALIYNRLSIHNVILVLSSKFTHFDFG